MILQRLVEYYDRLASDPTNASALPAKGYSRQKVSFCVVLRPDGSLQQFQSLLDAGQRKPVPQLLLVPGEAKPSGQGINPGFLWDNAAYLLGVTKEGADGKKRERDQRSFAAFRERHLALEAAIDSEEYRAVCRFLRDWSPNLAQSHEAALADVTSHFGVFRIAGAQHFVHEDPVIRMYWLATPAGDTGGLRSMCLVTGKVEPIARLHEPKIKPVNGAQTAGALLVSFNDDAYTSLGKEQGSNAPVSEAAAFKYTNALNFLLQQDRRRILIGDATVVYWAERPSPAEEFVSDLLGPIVPGDIAEDTRRVDQVRLFLSQVRSGSGETNLLVGDNQTRFFILGLSPNASRVSVRFWIDTTVGELRTRLGQHMQDIELAGAFDSRLLTIRRLVEATGRAVVRGGRFEGYDTAAVSPLLAGALTRAVLTGEPYPRALLTAVLERIRADGAVRHERVAAIKAYLTRASRYQTRLPEVSVTLDTSRSDTAYLTGRLFALLEKIQADSAASDLNATIKDRYFSSASATPGIVFPRLLRLSQHHLAKLDVGARIWYDKQLGDVMSRLSTFPTHLGLHDQGLFAIGYFHQRQDFFTKKDHTNGAKA